MKFPVTAATDAQVSFLATTNRERARQFYVEGLGLQFVHEDEFALVLRCGDNHLRISEVENFSPQPFTVLGWEVADIAESVKALARQGIEPLRFPGLDYQEDGLWKSSSTGAWICWFHDPDKNLLSLSQHPIPA